jgi:6-phosphogluconolactonase (cycloisomerase 2 family)
MLLTASRISTRSSNALRSWAAFSLLTLTGLLTACGGGGGGGGSTPPPPAATLSSIGVTGAGNATTVAAGATLQLTATGVYSDSSKKDLTSTVTWTVAPSGIVTVSAAGLVTWVAAGSATVTATDGTVTGTLALTSSAAVLQSIAVTPATPSIAKGTTKQFVAMGTYTGGSQLDITNTVTWSSSNTTDVSISSASPNQGLATGLFPTAANTPATITATLGSVAGSTTLTVTAATLTTVTVTPAVSTVFTGFTEQLTATGTYSDGTTQDLTASATWSAPTSQTFITVGNGTTSKGFVTAGATATTTPVTVTATSGSVSGTGTVAVGAASLASITITPAAPSIAAGTTLQFKATGTFTPSGTQDITGAVVWTSGTAGVATISNAAGSQGVATAVAIGTSSIGASLTNASNVTITAAPVTLTVTNTIYAYASNFGDNTVSQYSIGAGGVLVPLSTATVNAGTEPFSVSVEPTGQYVYVADFLAQSVSQYTIGSTGLLAPVGSGTVSTGTRPNYVTIDHANKFAYVANYGAGTISQFSISNDGTLAALTPATVSNGATTFPSSITIDPSNKYAYVTNWGGDTVNPLTTPSTVTPYNVNVDGTLTAMTNVPTIVTGGGPNVIVVDPLDRFAYVVNAGNNSVSQYTLRSDGALIPVVVGGTAVPTVAAGVKPFGLTVDPTSHYLYVANAGDGTISQYSINQTSGALTALTPASVQSINGSSTSGVSSVSIDPTGTYLYAPNRGTVVGYQGSISQFAINPTTGALTPLTTPTVPAGLNPTAIALGY